MDIPLFPLPNLVLFPQVMLPLRIFEERYKRMVNHSIETSSPFGMVLLGDAEEESEQTIHRVGVTARVIEVERLDEGRMNILTAGESRFRIVRFIGRHPYWTASIELFDDVEESPDALRTMYDEVARLYRRALEMSLKARGAEFAEPPLPETPLGLSYMISYVLDLPTAEKQSLLETVSTVERLKSLGRHLAQTISQFERQNVQKKASGNGHLSR